MRVDEFDYQLPEELIAQTPLKSRSSSRLMVVDRKNKTLSHHHFYDIVNFFDENDCLVLNDTKVLPSRIFGHKVDTLALIEVLILKEVSNDIWEVLVKPARRVKEGTIINFNNLFTGRIVQKKEEGLCFIRFIYEGIFLEKLYTLGQMPLPPYIHEKLSDPDRYQTIYAKHLGSAAAPTAGLHFTKELLKQLEAKGVEILFVTLHVGLGTFRSVSVENIEDHKMHSEFYSMSEKVAERLNQAKTSHRRIISVGTTTTRTLESIFQKHNKFVSEQAETNIFIYPGFVFKAIDGLITNFHLPKSTLLMLVSAFSSKELMMKAYQEAIKDKYRFFSFGDAMFIK